MTMIFERDNYVLGRGTLYFEPFAPGTYVGDGEQYFGNTPSLVFKTQRVTRARQGSENGRLVTLDSLLISEGASGEFSTDNIKAHLLAWWYGAEASGIAAPQAAIVSTITVKRGRYYQLGVTEENPMGRRNLSNAVVVRQGEVTPIAEAGNFSLSEADGRIYITPTSTIADGTTIVVSAVGTTSEVIYKPSGKIVTGALRFSGDTAYGVGNDYYFPLVELSAAADIAAKGDVFQEIRFTFNARKRKGRELFYFAHRA